MHGMIIVVSGFWLWRLCICGNSSFLFIFEVNRDPTSPKNKVKSNGNLCTAGVQKDTDDGEKCGK
jgi:hypothetical protein